MIAIPLMNHLILIYLFRVLWHPCVAFGAVSITGRRLLPLTLQNHPPDEATMNKKVRGFQAHPRLEPLESKTLRRTP